MLSTYMHEDCSFWLLTPDAERDRVFPPMLQTIMAHGLVCWIRGLDCPPGHVLQICEETARHITLTRHSYIQSSNYVVTDTATDDYLSPQRLVREPPKALLACETPGMSTCPGSLSVAQPMACAHLRHPPHALPAEINRNRYVLRTNLRNTASKTAPTRYSHHDGCLTGGTPVPQGVDFHVTRPWIWPARFGQGRQCIECKQLVLVHRTQVFDVTLPRVVNNEEERACLLCKSGPWHKCVLQLRNVDSVGW